MAKQTMQIFGLDEINEVLYKLPKQYTYNFVTDLYSKVGRATVLKDARNKVPVAKEKWNLTNTYKSREHDPSNLKKSLGIIKYTNKRKPGVLIGPRSASTFGKGGKAYDGWYAHMIEFGHYRTDKNKNKLYYVPPQPFMRPAWDSNKNRIKDMIGVAFGKTATQFIKRMVKKVGI